MWLICIPCIFMFCFFFFLNSQGNLISHDTGSLVNFFSFCNLPITASIIELVIELNIVLFCYLLEPSFVF